MSLKIYCDGACSGNPGEAGSGIAVYAENQTLPDLFFGGYDAVGTNNTAELKALHRALVIASVNNKESHIFSDSKYSIECITNWAYGWKKKGWKKSGGEIKNLDLIKEMHAFYEIHKGRLTISHVKGHAGIEGNELADRMAVMAIAKKSSEFQPYNYGDVRSVLSMRAG